MSRTVRPTASWALPSARRCTASACLRRARAAGSSPWCASTRPMQLSIEASASPPPAPCAARCVASASSSSSIASGYRPSCALLSPALCSAQARSDLDRPSAPTTAPPPRRSCTLGTSCGPVCGPSPLVSASGAFSTGFSLETGGGRGGFPMSAHTFFCTLSPHAAPQDPTLRSLERSSAPSSSPQGTAKPPASSTPSSACSAAPSFRFTPSPA
mmetsp:Transcript_34764/g.85549  ORF Transcript_34764/g.85549 Transcript_34764/m.85549 type:complete len:214 (-) Transcript_34764:108-749(-)